jgi:hypothetical protein
MAENQRYTTQTKSNSGQEDIIYNNLYLLDIPKDDPDDFILRLNPKTKQVRYSTQDYGVFISTQTQTCTANVSSSFTYNITEDASKIEVINNSQIKVENKGVYNFQFSAQVYQTSGQAELYIWFKKNGINIINSATRMSVNHSSHTHYVASWNYIISLNPEDTAEISYQSNSNNTTFPFISASGNIPGTPSIILTVTQVK